MKAPPDKANDAFKHSAGIPRFPQV